MEKEQIDKAGKSYWKKEWMNRSKIALFDTSYYTNSIVDELFKKYLPNGDATLMEIGCAFSSYLPYFHKEFGYKIIGFDYECESAKATKKIYEQMNIDCRIWCHDFFKDPKNIPKADILFSWGVFEHFENLEYSIAQTIKYIKKEGYIITVIPNMNGVVGFLQKFFNRRVYDVHIPYTKEELEIAHTKAGYKSMFCDYVGIYQAGVVNFEGHRYASLLQKILAIPGKPLFYFSKVIPCAIDSKYLSPYVIYIGKKL